MNRFQLLFGVLLLISINTNASIIKNVTFAYWNKPDVEIFYLLPQSINKDTEIVFVIHGNSRNAIDYLSAWIPYVDNKNVIIAAPHFDKKNFRYFFLLETADSFGNINQNSNNYLNNSLSLFFNYFKSKYEFDSNAYRIFGHSAGAQFTHRYMLLSDDKRISTSVIANAGWYTFISNDNFPYGINNSPISISNNQLTNFMSKKSHLLIGSNDVGSQSLNSSKGAQLQGLTRVERANNYFNNLIKKAEEQNIPLRWTYKVVQDVDHDYLKMTEVASDILLRDIN